MYTYCSLLWVCVPSNLSVLFTCQLSLNSSVVVDRLYMDIMLMRDVESVKTSLMLSRVSQLRLCVRRLCLIACTLSYVLQLISLLHHTVSNFLSPILPLGFKYLRTSQVRPGHAEQVLYLWKLSASFIGLYYFFGKASTLLCAYSPIIDHLRRGVIDLYRPIGA